jgi:hypothetical protein
MMRLLRPWQVQGVALLAVVACSGFALAQQDKPKLIDEARKAQEIATQRAESDLRNTLTRARSVGPAEASSLLKQELRRIDANEEIDPDRRSAMVRMLKDRIRMTEAVKPSGDDKPISDAAKSNKVNARRAELEKEAAEREKIKAVITAINQLQGQGRTEEAERQARDLARQYPDNSAARAMGRNGSLNARVREGRDLLAEQDKRHTAAMMDLEKTSVPLKGDVEFDKERWAQVNKRGGGQLTNKEKALLKALNEPVDAKFRNSRFEDVIEYLSTASGQPIVLDKLAMEDQNLTYDSPVNFVAPKPVTMRTALRKVLQDNGLTFVIKDEVIYVTTAKKARDMMVTRVYPIGDLVTLGFFADGTKFLPGVTMQAEADSAKFIIDMIRDSIDPMSWQGNGGSGTVTYSPLTKSLVIRQSAEVHMMLKSGLK